MRKVLGRARALLLSLLLPTLLTVMGFSDVAAHPLPPPPPSSGSGTESDAATIALDEEEEANEPTSMVSTDQPESLDPTLDSEEDSEPQTPEQKADLGDSIEVAPLAASAGQSRDPLPGPSASDNPSGRGWYLPVVTSTWTSEKLETGGNRQVYTVTYKNDRTPLLHSTDIRVWHQYEIDADSVTRYKVSCEAEGQRSTCPSPGTKGMPDGWKEFNSEKGDVYYTFWGIIGIERQGTVTFTIEVETDVPDGEDPCLAFPYAATKAWARASVNGFETPGSGADVENEGVAEFGECPDGVVSMTNELVSPLNPITGEPNIAVAQDPIRFEASWENTTSQPVTLPIYYSYAVPGAGNITDATWECNTNVGDCPDFGNSSQAVTDESEKPQWIFGSDPEDETTYVTLVAGQKLTYDITLATTTQTCSDVGYYDLKSFTNRGVVGADPSPVRTSSPSKPIELGCANWVVDESFAGEEVTDPLWRVVTSEATDSPPACLTRATQNRDLPALGKCETTTGSPSVTFSPADTGLPAGFLQLTSDNNDQVGAVAYDRQLPAKNGLVLEFTQYQFGEGRDGADGIGFFLADGSDDLDSVGPGGGALGYANDKGGAEGLPEGYLGVGFDERGNYAASSNIAAPQCGGSGAQVEDRDSITLRGPGNGNTGYCAVGSTVRLTDLGIADRGSAYTLRARRRGSSEADLRSALLASQRHTRVTVYPQAEGAPGPRVTVMMDFGDGYVTVLDRMMDKAIPDTIRFGFLGSTGGTKDAHLLSDVRVGTVVTPPDLDFVKSLSAAGGTKASYDVGDDVPYSFFVDNNGEVDLHNVQVSDPGLDSTTCEPGSLHVGGRIACTGTHKVTEADRDSLHYLNTATVSAAVEEGGGVAISAVDSVDVPVNPTAEDASEVVTPGQSVTFHIFDDGLIPGLVMPDDKEKLSVELLNLSGTPSGGQVTVQGQGTWTFNSQTGAVTFTPTGSSYDGVVSPIKYRATSKLDVDGVRGFDEGTLSVTYSNAPTPKCTAKQHEGSAETWVFGEGGKIVFGDGMPEGPSSAPFTGVKSLEASSFVVSDMWGELQFVVDPGQGRILTKSGTPMKKGGDGEDADDNIILPIGIGASSATAFPCEQGSGRYVVVTSDATATSPGQLTHRMIDMSVNDGEGGLIGPESIEMGPAGAAGPAVTSVPSVRGGGYWVINPLRGSDSVMAYEFHQGNPMKTHQTEYLPRSGLANATGYEDIRFSSDFKLMATLSSNSGATTTSRTQVRLLSFNAESGVVGSLADRNWGSKNQLGYSLEFSPDGGRLYFSSVPTSGNGFLVQAGTIGGTAERPTLPLNLNLTQVASGNEGGALRVGPDEELYWAASNSGDVRRLSAPNNGGTDWSTVPLAEGSMSGLSLANTLSDCSIPPRGFDVVMLSRGGEPIAGARFALYLLDPESEGNGAVQPGFTEDPEEPGLFSITDLQVGTYQLVQTLAPETYTLLAQPIRVNVYEDGRIAVSTNPRSPQIALKNDGAGNYTIEITGTQALTLPFAGTPRSWLMLFGALVTAGAVTETVRRRKANPATAVSRPKPRHAA